MTWWAIHYSSGRIEINSYSTPLATVSILCAPYVHEHINWTKLLDKCQQHCRTGGSKQDGCVEAPNLCASPI